MIPLEALLLRSRALTGETAVQVQANGAAQCPEMAGPPTKRRFYNKNRDIEARREYAR